MKCIYIKKNFSLSTLQFHVQVNVTCLDCNYKESSNNYSKVLSGHCKGYPTPYFSVQVLKPTLNKAFLSLDILQKTIGIQSLFVFILI